MDAATPSPSVPAPGGLPLLVYDGDCRFCRVVVDRWRDAIGQQVGFVPYQELPTRFPALGDHDFKRAVHFFPPDGGVNRGAEAVFQAMAYCGRKRWLLWLYRHVPPVALASEGAYRLVAASREPLAMLRRIWYGRDLKLPTYHIASALFLRLLGVIYLIAFVSLWVQIDGLLGDHGILPASDYLERTHQIFSQQKPPMSDVWNVPTLVWLSPHTSFLHVLCAAGTLLSLMLVFGLLPLPALMLLWVDYLSFVHVGQDFLSFQWDILLLETGFVAIFLAPFAWRSKFLADRHPPRLALWLAWWLLFRLMLESGAVKLTWVVGLAHEGGAPIVNTWSALTALDYHYWTQPLPIWTSWYAAKLPEWFQHFSVICVFAIELGAPWLIFAPRVLRYIACGAITLLMLLIAATGNYNFFNLLTLLLALVLLDDRAWPRFLRRRIRGTDWPALASPIRWRMFLLVPLAALLVFLGARQVKECVAPNPARQQPLDLESRLHPFALVNSYGLFRNMTTTRPEIVIEGTSDSLHWKEYEFRWKPGNVAIAPRLCAPYQPRLDWQMWFEALRLEYFFNATGDIDPREMDPWFQLFLKRVLENEPAVLGLLSGNPFPDAPPVYIRIALYQYRFTTAAERRQTGDWWHREQVWIGPAWH
jgi:lipase maturation factor 1